MTEKELKKEIRKLRKLKLACRPNTDERLSLHHQIKVLQEKLQALKEIDKDKEPIIKEILKLDSSFIELEINLNKFTVEQLEKHLAKLKEKK